MNERNPLSDPHFIEEELFATKQALFSAKTVKEMLFLQNKMGYLQKQMKQLKKGRGK